MNFQEYRKHDATSLAQLVKSKQVTSLELLELAIHRCEQVNGKVNAVVTKLYEQAKNDAQQSLPDTPLAGVPFLVKDLAIELKDTPYSAGCKAFTGYISKYDSDLGNRIRKSGLITFGKTNTPEFGLTPYTEGKHLGHCKNPFNLEYTPGGSSGGSASAVASGIVPLATASDGGGSIRIPASCCGLFGLKPSRGRVPLGKTYGEMWSGAVVENCVSRSVRDSAAYLDIMRGGGVGEPYLMLAPERPYVEEVGRTVEKLKIGVCTKHPLGQPVDAENIAAINNTVKLLTSLGHEVVEVELPYTMEVLSELLFTLVASETAVDVEHSAVALGRKPRASDFESNTWMLAKIGNAISGRDVAFYKRKWNEVSRKCGAFHLKYDLLLTPTLGRIPAQLGDLHNSPFEETMLKIASKLGIVALLRHTDIVDKVAEKVYGYIPYTPTANITGQPAMSVPLYWTAQNIPIGVMFTAAMGEEGVLYRLAAQLEEAQPWFDKVAEL
jgi:amidase